MTSINYNEFQAGQGVSAPALNENFTLTNNAIETLETSLNSAASSISSLSNLKANKNGSSANQFNVADATDDTNAVSLSQLNTALIPLSPTGSIIWFAGQSTPSGYLLCDGSNVSRTTYADLFEVIGIIYGAGDSSTTFTLPKLTDARFIEGGSTVGTSKSAGLPNITAQWETSCYASGSPSGAVENYNITGITGSSFMTVNGGHTFNASRSSSIYGNSSTVQPKSLVLLPCIKY